MDLQDLILQGKWYPARETNRHLIGYCIFHNDKNTANLFINKSEPFKGHFRCFACGATGVISGDLIKTMSKKKTICRKPRPIDWTCLNAGYKMQTSINGKHRELEKKWNVKTLLKYGIGWNGEAHTFPMRDEKGKIIGIQRRFADDSKKSIFGSRLGLFIPNIHINEVVISEGISDSAVATELGFFGLGLPSASCGHKMAAKFLIKHKIGEVIITVDNDNAGMKNSQKLQKILLTSGIKCDIIVPGKYSDLRDYYINEGKEKITKLLKGE